MEPARLSLTICQGANFDFPFELLDGDDEVMPFASGTAVLYVSQPDPPNYVYFSVSSDDGRFNLSAAPGETLTLVPGTWPFQLDVEPGGSDGGGVERIAIGHVEVIANVD